MRITTRHIHLCKARVQVEFPDNQMQFTGSHIPLDRIFYTSETALGFFYDSLSYNSFSVFFRQYCSFFLLFFFLSNFAAEERFSYNIGL